MKPLTNIDLAWLKTPLVRAFLWYAVGGIALLFSLFPYLSEFITQSITVPDLYNSSVPFFNMGMLSNLFFFIAACIIVIFSFIQAQLFQHSSAFLLFAHPKAPVVMSVVLVLDVLLIIIKSQYSVLLQCGALLAPVLYAYTVQNGAKKNKQRAWPAWCGILLIAMAIFFMYAEFIFQKPMLYNDFFRIPEQYRSDKDADYQSTTYLANKYSAEGTFQKISVDTASDWKSNAACTPVPEKDKGVERLVAEYEGLNKEILGSLWTVNNRSVFQPILTYREDRLCIVPADGPVIFENNSNFSNIHTANVQLMSRLEALGISPPQSLKLAITTTATNKQKDASLYFQTSLPEAIMQANFRGQFKHQEHYLLPAHEYSLGKPLPSISHQYGLAITMLIGPVSQWLSGGSIDYGIFMRAFNSFWYIDFLIFMLCIWGIYRNPQHVLLFALFYLVGRLFFSYFFVLASAGGHQIFRSIMFAPALYCIFRYHQHKSIAWLIALLGVFFLGIFFNASFGLFLPLAFLGVLALQAIVSRHFDGKDALACIVSLLALGAGVYLLTLSENVIAGYFLSGATSAPYIGTKKLLALSFAFVFLMCAFVHMNSHKSVHSTIFLFSAFYSQTLMLYYIRGGDIEFYKYFTMQHVTPFIIYFIFLYDLHKKSTTEKLFQRLYAYITIFICLVCFVKIIDFTRSAKKFESLTEATKIYDWDFKKASLRSTIDPVYFSDSIKLINKYTPKDTATIGIVSQYDALLLFLSDKLSALPHFDLASCLISSTESNIFVHALQKNNPEYLFVDSDIDIPYILDIVSIRAYGEVLHFESRQRATVLNEMRNIYLRVINNYEPVERGKLLTVYKRKNKGNS